MTKKRTYQNRNKGKGNVVIKTFHVGNYEIRISENKLEIETAAKNWKIVYKDGTAPYNFITNLVFHEDVDNLTKLISALYATNLFCENIPLVETFLHIAASTIEVAEKEMSEEDDQKILEEEKGIQEDKDKLNSEPDKKEE